MMKSQEKQTFIEKKEKTAVFAVFITIRFLHSVIELYEEVFIEQILSGY